MAMMKIVELPQNEADEVVALGRMVSFVCQRAKQLNLEMSTYFLEMALTSLVQDIGDCEVPPSGSGERGLISVANDIH